MILDGVTFVIPPPKEIGPGIVSYLCGQPDKPETTAGGREKTGALLYLAEGEFLLAVDLEEGFCVWSRRLGGDIEAAPAVARGVVYVGSRDGVLYALDAITRAELWTFHTGNSIEASPALGAGMVYLASTDGTVYALGNGERPPTDDLVVEPPPFQPAPASADPVPDPSVVADRGTAPTITLPPEAPDEPSEGGGGGGPNTM